MQPSAIALSVTLVLALLLAMPFFGHEMTRADRSTR